MSFIDEFQANLDVLPTILQKKYALLRDLDKSLIGIQRQNGQRCEQEIRDMKQRIKAGGVAPDSLLLKFSDEALDEQKHAIRIADEKVALAVQAYDMVDTHIQQLDQYLKKLDEEIRRAEKDNVASPGSATPAFDNNVKQGKSGESGRGRKKTRLATATAAAAAAISATTTSSNPSGMDLDLPVDPNEPTYCICNQVSYGEMVACDNPGCKIEWFHYGCVGLKEPPKGNWYCPDCVGTKRHRKGKS